MDLAGIFGIRMTTIMALIAADVIMAVALAINKGEFNWLKLLSFYRTNIVPYLLGYLAFSVLVSFASTELLGEYSVIAEQGTLWLVWTAIVKEIGYDSFWAHAKELYENLAEE